MKAAQIRWPRIIAVFAYPLVALGALTGLIGNVAAAIFLLSVLFRISSSIGYVSGWVILTFQILNIPLTIMTALLGWAHRADPDERKRSFFNISFLLGATSTCWFIVFLLWAIIMAGLQNK